MGRHEGMRAGGRGGRSRGRSKKGEPPVAHHSHLRATLRYGEGEEGKIGDSEQD
jgi:hypothetical protein